MLNFHSLLADRERGFNDMIKMLKDLFGDKLKSSMESICIGVTHIDSYGNSRIQQIEDIKKIFAKHENAKDFIDRVITFDPLDKPLKGGLKREELLLYIKNLKPIADCKSIFNTVLLDSDKVELNLISREITERLKKDLGLNISSITANNFKSSAKNFNLLKNLEIIRHSEINEHLKTNKELIMKKLNEIVMEFREKCSLFEFREADRIYSLLSTSLSYYDDNDIRKTVNLSNLQTYRNGRALYKKQQDDTLRGTQEEMERLREDFENERRSNKELIEKMEEEREREKLQQQEDELRRAQEEKERLREDFERERENNKKLLEKMEKDREKREREKVRNRSVIYCDIKADDQYAIVFDHNK